MSRTIFGFRISPFTAEQVGAKVVEEAPPGGRLGLVVTPNIHHIALQRRLPAFRAAYESAALIVCDGFPVHYYAQLRRVATAGRVTGCDIIDAVMRRTSFPAHHRLFFVVDGPATADALADWAQKRGMADRIATAVPAYGFEQDPAQSRALAAAIREHGATLLVMAVGAPKSEIFVNSHRSLLPACWALCVGRAVKVALGLSPRPPRLFWRYNLEWLWWLLHEPARIAARCSRSVPGFLTAVASDLRESRG